MRRTLASLALVACAALGSPHHGLSQASETLPAASVEPFKVGTFEVGNDGQNRVGIVLRDQYVVEVAKANEDLERNHHFAPIPAPEDMLALIERYDYGLKERIYEIVNHVVSSGYLENRPAYVHRLSDVRTLAPIRDRYPEKILNAAVNYYEHAGEGGNPEEQAKVAAERRANRGIPYLFHKTTRGGVIGQGDTIVIPYGRDRADWEVELATVIGRKAKYVPANQAQDYIFGYTIMIDVSDRGGRPSTGFQGGSDWYIGKGRDTYAPMGPFIVPKEFYKYPAQPVHQRFVLRREGRGGAIMQDSGTEDMIHTIAELVEYGSSISTLYPGDVIAAGSPSGVGTGRAERGYQWFMQPGDIAEATLEGIGTLHHPVVQETTRPQGTGSFAPETPWEPEPGTDPWKTQPKVP